MVTTVPQQAMSGAYGIRNLSIITLLVGESINVMSEVIPIIAKGGFIAKMQALGSFFMLSDELSALKDVAWKEAISETRELDQSEQDALVSMFNSKVSIGNKELEGVVKKAFALLIKGTDVVSGVRDFVDYIKKLLG